MCRACLQAEVNRRLLAKRSDALKQVIQQTVEEFRPILGGWHEDIVSAVRDGLGVDLADAGKVEIAVGRLLDPYRRAWTTTFQTAWTDAAEAGRSVAIQRHSLEIDWEITDPDTVHALESNGEQAAEMIQARMTGDLGKAISEAYQDGVGPDRIADRLQNDVFPDMQGYEARRAARTEGIGGANRGRLSGFEDADAGGKRWMARDDDDTRHSHNEADNQTVSLGEAFTVGGHDCQYPGDPSLPASERVNCRCLVLPVFDS